MIRKLAIGAIIFLGLAAQAHAQTYDCFIARTAPAEVYASHDDLVANFQRLATPALFKIVVEGRLVRIYDMKNGGRLAWTTEVYQTAGDVKVSRARLNDITTGLLQVATGVSDGEKEPSVLFIFSFDNGKQAASKGPCRLM
jgi:hypothetical protein